MSSSTCNLDFELPAVVSYIYGSFYAVVLLVVAVWSFLTVYEKYEIYRHRRELAESMLNVEAEMVSSPSFVSDITSNSRNNNNNNNDNNNNINNEKHIGNGSSSDSELSSQNRPQVSKHIRSASVTNGNNNNNNTDRDKLECPYCHKSYAIKEYDNHISICSNIDKGPNPLDSLPPAMNSNANTTMQLVVSTSNVISSSSPSNNTTNGSGTIRRRRRKRRFNCFRFTMEWFTDAWRKRRCYLPIITHVIDQMTDIGVIITFENLYRQEQNDSSVDCPGNSLALLVASIISFLFYRFVSALVIYTQTRKIHRGLMQLFDLELYRALWLNYKLESTKPNNPQRWIQSLEAMFEAFPQTLIQLFFVVKVGGSQANSLVILSLGMSIWSMITKSVSEDRLLFQENYRNAKVNCLECHNVIFCRCISWLYILRLIFRIFDILWRIGLLLLLWIIVGGLALLIVMSAEMTLLIILSYYCKNTSILTWILKSPVENPSKLAAAKINTPKIFAIYRWTVHLLLIVCIWLFAIGQIYPDCNNEDLCVPLSEREELFFNDTLVLLCVVFVSIATIINPVFFFFLSYYLHGFVDKPVTVERTLDELIKLEDWDGIDELIEFGFVFGENEYLDILFNINYESFGCQLLWTVYCLLVEQYAWDFLLITNPNDVHSDYNTFSSNKKNKNEKLTSLSSRDFHRLLTILCEILEIEKREFDEYYDAKEKGRAYQSKVLGHGKGRNRKRHTDNHGNKEDVILTIDKKNENDGRFKSPFFSHLNDFEIFRVSLLLEAISIIDETTQGDGEFTIREVQLAKTKYNEIVEECGVTLDLKKQEMLDKIENFYKYVKNIAISDSRIEWPSNECMTPIVDALRGHRTPEFKELLDKDETDLTIKYDNSHGSQLLSFVIECGHADCLEAMLDKRRFVLTTYYSSMINTDNNKLFDLNYVDNLSQTPLILCCKYGHYDCYLLLYRYNFADDGAAHDHEHGTSLLPPLPFESDEFSKSGEGGEHKIQAPDDNNNMPNINSNKLKPTRSYENHLGVNMHLSEISGSGGNGGGGGAQPAGLSHLGKRPSARLSGLHLKNLEIEHSKDNRSGNASQYDRKNLVNFNYIDRHGRTCLHHTIIGASKTHKHSQNKLKNNESNNNNNNNNNLNLNYINPNNHNDNFNDRERFIQFRKILVSILSVPDLTIIEQSDHSKLWTPLCEAVASGRLEFVRILIDYGANTDVLDASGDSLIHIAAKYNHADILSYLLTEINNKTWDLNVKNRDNYTPLDLTIINKNDGYECFKLLSVFTQKMALVKSLMFAIKQSSLLIVKYLLEQSHIETNFRDNDGLTPLRCAAECGNEEILELLIQYGARDDVDYNGENSVFYAIKNKHLQCLRLLYKHNFNFNLINHKGERIENMLPNDKEKSTVDKSIDIFLKCVRNGTVDQYNISQDNKNNNNNGYNNNNMHDVNYNNSYNSNHDLIGQLTSYQLPDKPQAISAQSSIVNPLY